MTEEIENCCLNKEMKPRWLVWLTWLDFDRGEKKPARRQALLRLCLESAASIPSGGSLTLERLSLSNTKAPSSTRFLRQHERRARYCWRSSPAFT